MSKKDKAYTLWLQWRGGGWTPTLTASGKVTFGTGRQLLARFRDQYYSNGWWRGHTRILPVGKKP